MHNITDPFLKVTRAPVPLKGHIEHGNRTIVIVEQGSLGYASDNGQPLLLPPGIHGNYINKISINLYINLIICSINMFCSMDQ